VNKLFTLHGVKYCVGHVVIKTPSAGTGGGFSFIA
jgi:hypothetical protein